MFGGRFVTVWLCLCKMITWEEIKNTFFAFNFLTNIVQMREVGLFKNTSSRVVYPYLQRLYLFSVWKDFLVLHYSMWTLFNFYFTAQSKQLAIKCFFVKKKVFFFHRLSKLITALLFFRQNICFRKLLLKFKKFVWWSFCDSLIVFM